jgi:transcriptional regulator with XRE-family HTH domain
MINRIGMPREQQVRGDNRLGTYLKDRRSRLDPAALGFAVGRRRTPGLRREEVAQRSNISPTWYTWLEQGRGGAPSAEVLNRIAAALMLTDIEREHLFLLGLGRPPEVRYKAVGGVTPRLQRLLDAFEVSPALIRTATWDVVAWNRAAAAVFTDYGALPAAQRNILRIVFGDPRVRAAQHDWEGVARFVVGAFRADAARAGAVSEVGELVDELCRSSPEFAALWRDNDVHVHGEGVKHLRHPMLGPIAFEYSAFAVDGRPDLSMIVYNPVASSDAERIHSLLTSQVLASVNTGSSAPGGL